MNLDDIKKIKIDRRKLSKEHKEYWRDRFNMNRKKLKLNKKKAAEWADRSMAIHIATEKEFGVT